MALSVLLMGLRVLAMMEVILMMLIRMLKLNTKSNKIHLYPHKKL